MSSASVTAGAQAPQYIKNWLTVLKSDKKTVFTAASKASEASNWLMSLTSNHREIEDAV